MITLNQKQLEKAVKLVAAAARLNELQKLEGYVPSALISRRKGILKAQIAKLKGEENNTENEVHIRIELPAEEKKVTKKDNSFSINLGKLLSGKFNEIEEVDEDDNDVLVSLKSLFPEKHQMVLGKVVTEL